MDSDAGYLSGAALLILLLLFDFIMTAFASALHHISDTELQPAFSEQEKPPDEISALREQSARLKHTCWLLHAVLPCGKFRTGDAGTQKCRTLGYAPLSSGGEDSCAFIAVYLCDDSPL